VESCCKSIDVPQPGAAFKLDKYLVTAGRMRRFIEATNGNVRSYIQANKPSWWEAVWDKYVPTQMDDGTALSHEGVYQELGPNLFFDVTGGNDGCVAEQNGARTYFLPTDRSRQLFNDANDYTQDDLDEKALNCTTFFMFSAFCAWDGGRLPTQAEIDFAYTGGAANPDTTHRYPWGQNPSPQGWNSSWNNLAEATANDAPNPAATAKECAGGCDINRANYWYNWWSPANRVCGKNGNPDSCDYSVHVAPPGRFPAGNGPFGHSDLAGLVLEVTSNISGTPGTDPEAGADDKPPTERKVVWGRNGSWEGHGIPFYPFVPPQPTPPPAFRSTSKYRSMGARCAR
jgi:formylglycine-generating enzyme required for sulfatase activity